MNSNILAGLLKSFYDKFDMSSFENRLKLQKIVYLLQAYGLNIGYNYSYYLYGPYSTELTRDGFSMPKLSEVNEIKFTNQTDQVKFENFKTFIGTKKDDIEWLEMTASIHFLLGQGYDEPKVIEFISSKHNNAFIAKKQRIRDILSEVKRTLQC